VSIKPGSTIIRDASITAASALISGGDDLLVLDQDVGPLEISDGGIVAEHHAAFEQGTSRTALGDSRPPDAGDGGRREQGGSGFHQSAPVDSRCCQSRQ
jgi:hypothetical protein